MTTVRSRTFRSGNSQAVRLPKDVAFDGDIEVTIVKSGDVLTIFPARPSVADMLDKLAALPRPTVREERDLDIIPERLKL